MKLILPVELAAKVEPLLPPLPNVFITPHCSALTPQLYDRIVALFIDNLTRYQNGKPLRNIVNKNAGY